MNILYLAQFAHGAEQAKKFNNITDEELYYARYQESIYRILSSTGHNIEVSSNLSRVLNMQTKPDYIFTLYNRANFKNSEIFVSAIAEYHKIPYLGARPNIRAIAEDKHLSKIVATKAGIPTAQWLVFSPEAQNNLSPAKFNFPPPFFIKPRFGASSLHISNQSIAYSIDQAIIQINRLFADNLEVIVEQFIEGTSYTVPLILNAELYPYPLNPVKEESTERIITYAQKRKTAPGLNRVVCEEKGIIDSLHEAVLRYHELVKPLDYARFDFIMTESGVPYFLEMNLCCNLGEHAAIALAGYSHGFSHRDLVVAILERSLKRQSVAFK